MSGKIVSALRRVVIGSKAPRGLKNASLSGGSSAGSPSLDPELATGSRKKPATVEDSLVVFRAPLPLSSRKARFSIIFSVSCLLLHDALAIVLKFNGESQGKGRLLLLSSA